MTGARRASITHLPATATSTRCRTIGGVGGTTPELVNDARYVGNRALAVGQNGLVVYGTALR